MEISWEVFGILGFGSIFGSLVTLVAQHFLNKSKAEQERIFKLKKEAYFKASVTLSKLIDETVSVSIDKEVGVQRLLGHLSKVQGELAPVLLVAPEKVRNIVTEISDLTRNGITYHINTKSNPQLSNWRSDIKSKSEEAFQLMRADLGLN